MKTIALIATLTLAALPLSAAPIRYDGWVELREDRARTGAQLTFGNDWEYLPIRVDLSGDDATGRLDIHQWDVYDSTKTQLVYSVPPQSLDLVVTPSQIEPGKYSSRGNVSTPNGDFLTILYARGIFGGKASHGAIWRIQMHLDVPIRDIPGVRRGQLEVNIMEAPEPATLALLIPSLALLVAHRRKPRRVS